MLNAPTISSPAAAVTTKPTHKLTNTARLMWAERSASQRIKSSARTAPAKLGNIPLPSVTNCSSLIATCPVSRSLAPKFGPSSSSSAACLIASIAARPGSRAPKSSLGSIWMNPRSSSGAAGLPFISTRQEKLGKRPANRSSSVSDSMFIGRASASGGMPRAFPASMPIVRACITPRRLGSALSASISGLDAASRPTVSDT